MGQYLECVMVLKNIQGSPLRYIEGADRDDESNWVAPMLEPISFTYEVWFRDTEGVGLVFAAFNSGFKRGYV